MAQVRGLGPRAGSCLALFCIHRMNLVYGALVLTSRALGRRINCHIIIIMAGTLDYSVLKEQPGIYSRPDV